VIAGTLEIAQGGSYTFQTGSDDGTMLYIDGSPSAQVSNNDNHGFTTKTSSPITLTAGVHSIVIGYFQGGGGAQLLVNYSGPDTGNVTTAIPDTALLTTSAAAFPSASQTYSNNISVTSNATINVTGSLAATVGNLSLPGTTLSLASGDLSTNAYGLTVGSLNVSGTAGINVAASSSLGAGTLQVTAPPTFAAASSLNIAAGTVKFNVSSAGATVGAGVVATVNSGATLELAGSASALASTSAKVSIVNNSSSSGVVVSGVGQVVGGIDGAGTTQVNAGSDLTADHIVQTALVIGGAAGSSGLVTIDASDASGNPLAASVTSLSGTLALAGPIQPDAPFAAGVSSATNVAASGSNLGGDPLTAGSSSAAGTTGGASAAVPEPSSVLLALLALIAAGVPLASRSVRQGRADARR
jgi:PA14 domain